MPTRLRSGILLVLFGFLVVGITAAGFLHFNTLCGEETVLERASPDGKYVAVLFRRNCGATTPYVAHINLHQAGSKFRSGFFDGTVKGGEVFTSSKYSGDRFCWSAPSKLSIGYPEVQVRNWHDVAIDTDYRNPQCQ